MDKRLSFGEIRLGAVLEEVSARPARETPFRIAVLGDFGGRANRGVCETGAALAARRPLMVDRDNFEEVLERLDVRLARTIIGDDNQPVSVRFRELDDFHPDRLFANVELFQSLRKTRRRLFDSAAFAQAAAEVRAWGQGPEPPRAPVPPQTPETPQISSEGLLDQMLQEAEQTAASPTPGAVDWNSFIREIVAPHIVPGADPQLGQLAGCVDAVVGKSMRALLHHPHFQELEAAWRGLHLLVRRLETDPQLKLYLLDLSRQELAADLAGEDLASSGLYRLLVEQTVRTPGAAPWALLASNYVFGAAAEDVQLLGRIAKVAAAAGAPFLAGANGRVVGCPSPGQTPDPEAWAAPDAEAEEMWQALRRLPQASHLGLLWPRFLLRLPYGKAANPTEEFEFEELPDGPRHADYLWGNPAFLAACLLGQSFTQSGWDLRPGQLADVSGLPAHVCQQAGETQLRPCGELLLSERGVARILDRGLIPLLSIQGQDAVRLGGLHSLRGDRLAGRWA